MSQDNKQIIGGKAININSVVGGYEVPVDPMDDEQCESCQ